MDKEMIQKKMAIAQKTNEELSNVRSMLKSELECSSEYQEVVEQIRELTLEKRQIIDSNKIIAELTKKISEAKLELKECLEVLSSELYHYVKETDKMDIEDQDGKIFKIIINANLKKSNQKSLF